MITEEFLMWFAGFLEGDGCIHYSEKRHYLVIQISQCRSKEILELLEKEVGGKLYFDKSRSPITKNDVWKWMVWGNDVIEIFKRVRPYLRFREQEWQVKIDAWNKNKKMNPRTPGRPKKNFLKM